MKLTSYFGGDILKNKVREYRKQNKMTQQELADAVHVSSRTIISLEQGKYNPSIMLAYKIALLFGTTIEEIYCLEENKKLEDDSSED
ncbi:helix-turn-helix transcriptional regulator [Romboutsia maritimum]